MARNKLWLISSAGVMVLVFVLYWIRQPFQRALVAVSTYRAHIFTSPPSMASESRLRRLREDAQFYWDFSQLHLVRERQLKLLNPGLKPLVKEMGRRQVAGQDVQHSMHIYRDFEEER